MNLEGTGRSEFNLPYSAIREVGGPVQGLSPELSGVFLLGLMQG